MKHPAQRAEYPRRLVYEVTRLLSQHTPASIVGVRVRVSVGGMSFRVLVWGISWSSPFEVFSGYSTFLSPFCVTTSLALWFRHPPRERKIPGSNPVCAGIFPGSSHTSDFKSGTPVATLPGAWRYRIWAGIGWPGVSILWLGEMESLICNFHLSVAAGTIVWADPSLRCTSMLLGR